MRFGKLIFLFVLSHVEASLYPGYARVEENLVVLSRDGCTLKVYLPVNYRKELSPDMIASLKEIKTCTDPKESLTCEDSDTQLTAWTISAGASREDIGGSAQFKCFIEKASGNSELFASQMPDMPLDHHFALFAENYVPRFDHGQNGLFCAKVFNRSREVWRIVLGEERLEKLLKKPARALARPCVPAPVPSKKRWWEFWRK